MEPRPGTLALDALLSDSIVQLAMRADGVEPQALRSLLVDVGRKIAARRESRVVMGRATFRRGAAFGALERVASSFRGDAVGDGALCASAPC